MAKKIGLKISDIPQHKLNEVAQSIGNYTTVLIDNNQPWGCATFVKCGNKHGLLTAQHVAKSLNLISNSNDNLGIAINNVPSAFTIEKKYLKHHEVGVPLCEEFGPDIAFLEILDYNKLGWIKAYQSFWDVSFDTGRNIMGARLCNSEGLWAIAGMPEEFTETLGPQKSFDQLLGLPAQAFFGGTEKTFEKYGFDYIESKADYNSRDALPKTFGGISGGGLWEIPMSVSSNNMDTLQIKEPILSGLVFYETAFSNNSRLLRCHGPKSIYEHLPKCIETKKS